MMIEASKISKMIEDTVSDALIKAVQNLSIEIDEEELLKMLHDSKKQYKSGYNDRDSEIVRCKDCKHYMTIHCTCDGCCISDDWFCADGERKNAE